LKVRGTPESLLEAFQDCMQLGQGELYRVNNEYFFEVGLPEHTAVQPNYDLIEADFWHVVQDCLREAEYDEDEAFEILKTVTDQLDP
jgi:hypothetical protein